MADFEFQFADAHEFAQKMAAAPQVVQEEMTQGMDRLTLQGEAWAKQKITENESVVTGHMRRSTTHTPAVFAGGVVTGTISNTAPYAPIVEGGRGPVTAKNAKVLAFKPKGSSGTVFRRSVGPAAAKPFMKPTAQRLQPEIKREFSAVMKRIIVRVSA